MDNNKMTIANNCGKEYEYTSSTGITGSFAIQKQGHLPATSAEKNKKCPMSLLDKEVRYWNVLSMVKLNNKEMGCFERLTAQTEMLLEICNQFPGWMWASVKKTNSLLLAWFEAGFIPVQEEAESYIVVKCNNMVPRNTACNRKDKHTITYFDGELNVNAEAYGHKDTISDEDLNDEIFTVLKPLKPLFEDCVCIETITTSSERRAVFAKNTVKRDMLLQLGYLFPDELLVVACNDTELEIKAFIEAGFVPLVFSDQILVTAKIMNVQEYA